MENKEKIREELLSKLFRSILECNMIELHNSVEQGIKIMTADIMNNQYENMYFLFHNASDKMEAMGNLLEIDSDSKRSKVFTYAVFWTMQMISDKLYSDYLLEKSIQNKYKEVKSICKSKYFHQMLTLLDQNGELPQSILAKQLSISTNALSNFLRRNEKYGLWAHKRHGKYNYYHLTTQGKDYLYYINDKS